LCYACRKERKYEDLPEEQQGKLLLLIGQMITRPKAHEKTPYKDDMDRLEEHKVALPSTFDIRFELLSNVFCRNSERWSKIPGELCRKISSESKTNRSFALSKEIIVYSSTNFHYNSTSSTCLTQYC
jgi:hypothetical protein